MTVLGDIDRRLLADPEARYRYLYGRARFMLEQISDGRHWGDPGLFAAGFLADLDQLETVQVDYFPEEK